MQDRRYKHTKTSQKTSQKTQPKNRKMAHMIRLSCSDSSTGSKVGRKKKAPIPQRQTIQLEDKWTIGDLKKETKKLFSKKGNVELLCGFPPSLITSEDTEIARNSIPKNENVIVRFISAASPSKTSNSSSTSSKSSKNEQEQGSSQIDAETGAGIRTRKKRAAAVIASSNFKEVIKAQDELMKNSQTSRSKTKSDSSQKKRTNNINTTKSTKRIKMPSSDGRKLDDGSIISSSINNSSTGRRPNNKSSSLMKMKDENDVATKLLSALENGGGGGKVGSFLRGAMKNAVTKSYEESQAFVRVSAVLSGKFELLRGDLSDDNNEGNGRRLGENDDTSNNSGEIGIYTAKYSKGKVGNQRGFHTDSFQLISKEALKAVIRAVYSDEDGGGKEMLRGRNMAQLSPRVFWSLIYHFKSDGVKSIEEALQKLEPSLDWKVLEGRKKTLSEKARENLRQKQQEQQSKDNKPIEKDEIDKGVKAVEAVEKAMEQVFQEGGAFARERAARAAIQRFEKFNSSSTENSKNWSLVTPTELDIDELKECISESDQVTTNPAVVLELANSLVKYCKVHNWRELANQDSSELINNLSSSLSQEHQQKEETIESWIDYAQTKSVEEIIFEICDSNEEAIVELREKAHAGTPKDLSLWVHTPEILKDEITDSDISVEQLKIWCERSKIALNTLEWLHWFATPVA